MDDAFQHLLYQNYIIADCITIQESRGFPKQTSDLATTTIFHCEERHSTETCYANKNTNKLVCTVVCGFALLPL